MADAATTAQPTNLSGTPVSQLSVGAPPASSTQPTQPNFNTITSTNTSPTTPVQLPPPPVPSTAAASGTVAGAQATSQTAQKSLADYQAALTPQTTPLDQQIQQILNGGVTLAQQDAQKGADTLALQQQQGIQAKQQAVQDANNEINTKTASYAQQEAQINNQGGGITSAVANAENAGLLRAKAADIGISQAKLTAAQGNLSLAQQQVTDAINLKYSTIESNIKVQQAQLAALQPLLSKEQSTQAAAQQAYLKAQDQAIQDQKDKETQINNIALNAASAGANPNIVAAIQKAPDVISAIAAAAPALGAKVANDLKQQAFDNAIKTRNANNDAARLSIEQQAPIQNIALEAAKAGASADVIKAITSSKTFGAALAAASPSINAPTLKNIANATVTTGVNQRQFVNGTNLDTAAKQKAASLGAIVLEGKPLDSMNAVTNAETQFGGFLAALSNAGVDLSSTAGSLYSGSNPGATKGFFTVHTTGDAEPALNNFVTALQGTTKTDGLIATLSKEQGTGALVSALQNNIPSPKDDASTLNTKLLNIKKAFGDAENGLLVSASNPPTITNKTTGQTLTLQMDGTYK